MKDVSQCLLSIIDEVEKYHSKIVTLEDVSQCYDQSVLALKTKEEETEVFLEEYEKLEARYKYYTRLAEELRDENAHMNTEMVRLENENKKLKQDLAQSKENEKKEPDDKENLKTELLRLQQEISRLSAVETENNQLRRKDEKSAQDEPQSSSKQSTVAEYNDLNKLYQNSLNENKLLRIKAEELIREKYNDKYETKHIFGVDMDTLRGKSVISSYMDIDSLIDDIDSKSPNPLKELT